MGVITISGQNYNLWLHSLSGIGDGKIERILGVFKDARSVFGASSRDLAKIEGLTNDNIKNIVDSANDEYLAECSDMLRRAGASFVSRFDEAYPALLKEIDKPPFGLFVKGRLPDDDAVKVAIVGSRRCSEYGRSVAYKLANELAAAGVVVVSGFARGIDSVAHRGALQAGGSTIGVLGCGVDVCYPAENHMLMEDMAALGCLISAYPPGTKPLPAYFPARNRIISGLCQALVVVEAGFKSGTLITVGQALDQGREVFAVPGNALSKLSEGTNMLIKEGAAVATCADDILSELRVERPTASESRFGRLSAPDTSGLDEHELIVFECISNTHEAGFDHIAETTGLAAHTLNHILVMLEMKGLVEKLPGLRYVARS
ncbi:MAG: DNA-processing protein DprA [Defluviitaleaceae bacterium]|nr:DNA-processing protein DprA [Defluviitaleaceae bacterium]